MSIVVRAKNLDSVPKQYPGWVINPSQEITLEYTDVLKWRESDVVIVDIESDDLQIGDESSWITGHASQMAHLHKEDENYLQITSQPPFGSKTLPDGSKLYRRKHGFKGDPIAAGQSGTIELVAPYTCKINELEFVNCNCEDEVDFIVCDSVDSVYQTMLGVPEGSRVSKLELNQFGFKVYMCDGFYKCKSEYDADLIQTMIVKVIYYNNSGASHTPKGSIVYHQVVAP